jgi:hypothetical protein
LIFDADVIRICVQFKTTKKGEATMGPKPKGKKKLAQWKTRQRNARAALKNLKKGSKESKAAFAKRSSRAKALASST